MSFFPFVPPIGGLTTLSVQDSATSTTDQITVPASVQEGDLIMLMDSALDDSDPGTVVPSGFTSIVNTYFDGGLGARLRQIISYKIAVDADASSTLTGMNAAQDRKMLYVFRGNAKITAVNTSTPTAEGTSGNPSTQSILAALLGAAPPVIIVGCYGSNGDVDPRTFSTTKDGEINATSTAYLAYKIYNSSPSNVNVDMDDEGGANVLQGFYLECS